MKRVVSYGGGTQSTAMILMCLEGVDGFERPDFGVYSDTGAEPQFINRYVEYFIDYVKRVYDFNIYRVQHADGLVKRIITIPKVRRDSEFYAVSSPPFYTKNRVTGAVGMLMKQCTGHFKQDPVRKAVTARLGRAVYHEMLIGISFDERERVRISPHKRRIYKYPLVDAEVSRSESIQYIKSLGLRPAQRSSCYFCPYHSDKYWIWLRRWHPSEFRRAIQLERIIQTNMDKVGSAIQLYLHRSCVNIKHAVFRNETQINLFPELIEECDGECGI